MGSALAIGALGTLSPSVAHAHFTLDAPPSWMSQDAIGSPQKQSPCGDEGGGMPTGTVTAFRPGETIAVKWTEIIPHDGWFRIALSYANRSDLMDPPYEINSAGLSVDAGIERPPVAPVLADGLFPHAAASITTPKSYSYDLTLPTMPCDKCTLQVIQIMLDHPNNAPYGYTYHHCADISINANADGGAAITDAAAGDGAAERAASSSANGCSCTIVGGSSSRGTGGLAAIAGIVICRSRFRSRSRAPSK
jgi:hypothetical protein